MIYAKPFLFIALIFSANFASSQINESIKLKITDPDGNSDEMIVRLKDEATQSFDGAWDAWKLFSTSDLQPSIYSKTVDNYDMAINSIPKMEKDSVVPVYIRAKITSGLYNVTAELLGTPPPNIKLALKDLESGQIYELSQNISHDFPVIADPNNDQERFELFYSTTTQFEVNDNTLQLANLGCLNWDYSIEDASQTEICNNFSSDEQAEVTGLLPGIYTAYTTDDYFLVDTILFEITYVDEEEEEDEEEEDSTYCEDHTDEAETEFASTAYFKNQPPLIYAFNNQIIIEHNEAIETPIELSIYSISGQLIYPQTTLNLSKRAEIDVRPFSSAIIVIVESEDGLYKKKLVIN
jgi:hypothetical protein